MLKIPVKEAPAGPAMDAAVAKALGQTVELSQNTAFQRMPIYYNGDITDDEYGQRYKWIVIPSYSTDIAAAWELDTIEWRWKFYETPNTLAVILFTSMDMQREAAWISPSLPEGTIVIQNVWQDNKASTYALGRCRAFLKAHGVEFVEITEEAREILYERLKELDHEGGHHAQDTS